MLLLSSLLYLLRSDSAFAAPIKNLTALRTEIAPSWVANPSGRGTWDLLYSCTFTIFLCVYTAIHLNVPPEESGFRFWLRKTKWVFIAIIAPEVVVYTSFEQWFLSRSFLKDLREIVKDNSTDEKYKEWPRSYSSKCRFDLVYAQYAVMGGFATDIQHIHNAITERVTITADGILFLARHGFFCQIKKDDIQDKSKADVLAKGLVCVQVLWVAGQAIERKIAGYPITLLEVHTLVHVVCAIIMYSLWIRKPLNVRDPTMVDFRDASDILAFMVEISRQDERLGSDTLPSRPGFKTARHRMGSSEPSIVWFKDPSKEPVRIKVNDPIGQLEISSPLESTSRDPTQEGIQISTLYSSTHEDDNGVTHYYAVGQDPDRSFEYVPVSNVGVVCKMFSGQASSLGYGPELPSGINFWDERVLTRDPKDGVTRTISLSKKDILRLNSTAEFLTRVKVSTIENPGVSKGPRHQTLGNFYRGYTGLTSPRGLLLLRALNFKGSIIDNIDSDTSYLVTAMAMIPAAYGCVHIGALSLIFPSSIERLLWKISCYYLIASAAAPGIWGLLAYMNDKIDQEWDVDMFYAIENMLAESWDFILNHGKLMKFLGYMVVFTLLGSIALVYGGARLYIVVESFISLRHVPVGVYESPAINFMNYIPHL